MSHSIFECLDCGTVDIFGGCGTDNDPTTSSGACRVCGSDRWIDREWQPGDWSKVSVEVPTVEEIEGGE